MRQLSSISSIITDYDAFLIDLWGVMHDGTVLYPGAQSALEALHQAGKTVIFLSNAPRKAEKAQDGLDRLGVPRSHYQQIITSGQTAYDLLCQQQPYGTRYYYLGPGKDEDVLDGLSAYQQTSDPAEAEFVLNTGFEYDFQPEAEILPTLEKLLAHRLPLICLNPDIEVVKQDGTQMLCAGWVAAAYAQAEGEVHYFGKPHDHVYEACRQKLRDDARVLCIGDNLLTDIRGANAQGYDSLLITGGVIYTIHGGYPDAPTLERLCAQAEASPVYVAELFAA